MDKLKFTDDLKLGVEVIDKQHSKLVDLINILIELESGQSDRDAMAQALDGLSDYIFEHFQDEEKMMKTVNYPDFAAHRELHAGFVKKSIEFSKQYRAGEDNLSVDVLLFLSKWLIDHIKGEDPKYVQLFQAHGY